MLNEGAADCLLPITRKGSDDVVDNQRPHPPSHSRPHHQPSYPNQLVKKWTERVDRCLEQQWKDSQHLLSFAKALKDSGGAIINSDDIVKELSGLGFAMMQKSIDLRQEIVNESYNNDFFDCHIKKPVYQYHHDSQPHSSQLLQNQYAYSRPADVGVLNSPRQKCSSSFYLPLSSQLNHHSPLLPKVQKQSPSIDSSPYKIPSEVSCQGYTSSYTYQHRQQRTRSDSFTHRQLTSSRDKKIGVPLLSSSPSVSNVCGLSLSDNDDIINNQQHDDSRSKNDTLQYQCTCNTELSAPGKMTIPAIRCQQCISSHSLQSATDQPITTQSINSDNSLAATPDPGKEDTSLNNYSRLTSTNDEQTTENDDTRDEYQGTLLSPIPHPSSPTDTADDIALTPATAAMPPKTATSTPSLGSAATAASLAVHITPSTPSSSSSMVHTMSTKFHFTRSTTSITATDRNKTMSRSSSSSSSTSSSVSLLTVATPLGRLSNKDSGKSSTRFVQSLLGRKTSLPALFSSSSKKEHHMPSSKTDT